MQEKTLFTYMVLTLLSFSGYSQYKISGYINSEGKEKKVYLSLLQYNEEVAIYPEQIITQTNTDSTGYFEISGKLLPQVNKLYRIHSNRDADSDGFEFFEEGVKKNYHNFIFSNTDSIYFPKKDIWFTTPLNTNNADVQWQNSVKYELNLIEEYSKTQNAGAKNQAKADFLNMYKQYCTDSVSEPLVKLLAYAHMKRNVSFTKEEYISAPEFYNNLLDELNEYYVGTSYYSQFQEEISKLSISLYKQKAALYKKVSYILGTIMLSLIGIILFLFRRIKKERAKVDTSNLQILTIQERKVADLIRSGKSNKEIANELFISLSTVKTHIGNLNSKLNSSNRGELIQKLQNHTGY